MQKIGQKGAIQLYFREGKLKFTSKIKSKPDLSTASLKENKYLNLTIDYLLKLVVKVL